MPDARRALGARGEELVARWYEARGYEVLDRNWRCRTGELDLVLIGRDVLVFCEVKTRTSDLFGAPVEAVTRTKVRRLRALAAEWMSEHRGRALGSIRFDVASVLARADSAPSVEVIEGAF
ncbi:MAG TPA: YraN family protein [Acidimicrobiia bacterium]